MSASFVVSIIQLLMLMGTFIFCIASILIVAGIFDLLCSKEEIRKKEIGTQLTWSIVAFIATLFFIYILFDTQNLIEINMVPQPPYGSYR